MPLAMIVLLQIYFLPAISDFLMNQYEDIIKLFQHNSCYIIEELVHENAVRVNSHET